MNQETRIVTVRVTPKASQQKVQEIEPDKLYVWVTAPPENNKANAAVISVVAGFYGVKPYQITMVRGQRSREKTLSIIIE